MPRWCLCPGKYGKRDKGEFRTVTTNIPLFDVCWKGYQRFVKKMLARSELESAKLEALKYNIGMQVLGLGWKQCAITWLHRGKMRSMEELVMHLKMLIREEMKLMSPPDPALDMPKRA